MFLFLKVVSNNKLKVLPLIAVLWISGILLVVPVRAGAQQPPKPVKVRNLYANGRIQEIGKMFNGHKHGRWAYYSAEGVLEARESWKEGIRSWRIEYNAAGKRIRSIDQDGKVKNAPACNCN